MMRAKVLPVALLLTIAGMAQTVVIDTLAAKQPWKPFQVYSFPRVGIANRPQLAGRINRDLAMDLLEVDIDTLKGPLFQQVWGDGEGGLPRLSTLTWTSARPLGNVLSFEFSGEACGAYCEDFSIHFNYDLRTGERLQFDSLFTQGGSIAVNDLVGKRWNMAVEREIALLEDSLQKHGRSDEEREELTASLNLYKSCLAERSGLPPYVEDFDLHRNELWLRVARCSTHADREIDVLYNMVMVLPYADIARYMRPEALALIK